MKQASETDETLSLFLLKTMPLRGASSLQDGIRSRLFSSQPVITARKNADTSVVTQQLIMLRPHDRSTRLFCASMAEVTLADKLQPDGPCKATLTAIRS